MVCEPEAGTKQRLVIAISSSIGGGAQFLILNMLPSLAGFFDIVVLCPKGYLSDQLRRVGSETVEIEIKLRSVFKLRALLKAERKKNQHLVINTHLFGTAFIVAVSTLGLAGIRKVATIENPIFYADMGSVKKMVYPLIARFLSWTVDEFIAVSKEINDSIWAVMKRSSRYIPNAVPSLRGKMLEKTDVCRVVRKIGMVGRLSSAKNPLCFIDAAKLILDECDDVEFILVGDGELMDDVAKRVSSYGMQKHITITGFVESSIEVMKSFDLIVIPSVFEGIPLVLLEAMSIGVPIIASSVGGIPQVIVDGENGILVPPKNPIAIKDAVLALRKSPDFYANIQRNALATIETQYLYEKIIGLYVDVLTGKKA